MPGCISVQSDDAPVGEVVPGTGVSSRVLVAWVVPAIEASYPRHPARGATPSATTARPRAAFFTGWSLTPVGNATAERM